MDSGMISARVSVLSWRSKGKRSAGYVYVYETGVVYSEETGETEYTWLVKEILYRAQSQSGEGGNRV